MVLLIYGHGKVTEIIERNIITWKKCYPNAPFLFVSPVNDPIKIEGYFNLTSQVSEHSGACLIRRTYDALKEVAKFNQDVIAIEYDTIAIRPYQIETGWFQSECKKNHDPRFKSEFYFANPWVFDITTLKEFVKIGESFLSDVELGFTDRWFGWVINYGHIPFKNISQFYTAILDDSPHLMVEVKKMIKNDACFIHGVKQKKDYDEIMMWLSSEKVNQ